jgi:hypothetical protein
MKPVKTRDSACKAAVRVPAHELPFMTGRDLLESGLIGMWRNRKDIRSTATFARRLRMRASTRKHS